MMLVAMVNLVNLVKEYGQVTLGLLQLSLGTIYRVGQKKTGPFLRVNNFVKVSGRKACYTPKVCKFCLEDIVKDSYQCIKYSLLNLHKCSLSLKL